MAAASHACVNRFVATALSDHVVFELYRTSVIVLRIRAASCLLVEIKSHKTDCVYSVHCAVVSRFDTGPIEQRRD